MSRPKSPFAENLGITVVDGGPEKSIAALRITDAHTNSLGIAHGGVIFTLADRAFGLACNRGPEPSVTMDMNIRYLRPAMVGQLLTATAERIHAGRSTSFIRIDVRDEDGHLVACVSGTAHLLGKKKE